MKALYRYLKFMLLVGRLPVQDDLKRANCVEIGKMGHWSCGWCGKHKLPRFECGCTIKGVYP